VLIRADGDYVTFSNMAFKKRVSEFLADCEAVKVNFEDGKYKIKDLDQVLDDYNDCVDVRTKERIIIANNKIATSEENTTKITEVDSLIVSVKASEKLPDQSEVLDMLNDVRQKLSDNEAIPSYLAGALKGALEKEDDLLAQLETILK
jgi:Golgi nucleoside diphosphatase